MSACSCVCGDCQAGHHCDRASCTVDAEVIDAEVVELEDDAPAEVVVEGRLCEATATAIAEPMTPTGRECWQRLYSTPTSPLRAYQDHGVRAVRPVPGDPHALDLELQHTDQHGDGYGQLPHRIRALAWRVLDRGPDAITARDHPGQVAMPRPLGPEAIDLLVEFPPALPHRRCDWQQMTNPGQLKHPGDDRNAWSYNVRYTDVYTRPSQQRPAAAMGDAALSAMGFHDLGYVSKKGIER